MSEPGAMAACDWSEAVCAHALQAAPPGEAAAIEDHLRGCAQCRQEWEALAPVLDAFASWPADVLRPAASLRDRLAQRIAADTGAEPVRPAPSAWREPEWENVAPGIECKLLANDATRHRVSMLVRLAPGAAYPPHTHAGTEELHLLDGELWIEERKLVPGEYNRAVIGTGDKLVWSKTGCTCVLITSTEDRLG